MTSGFPEEMNFEARPPASVRAAPAKVFTVTELNNCIKNLLEEAFPEVWVEGELSNLKTYPSGHVYFTLKDSESQIAAVMFRGHAQHLKFSLEPGLLVLARARPSAYVKRGGLQVIITALEPKRMGALQLAFEQLKAKLAREGLFDDGRKKPLPMLPQRIGVVTSLQGAAIRDILSVLKRRYANLEIVIFPVQVQGEQAKFQIAEAVEELNRLAPPLDVLLVGRGGGSMEDLWAFNEEIVARAIAASRIPVISCVGHETDFTIADFVADVRAPTPSAAAELVVQNKAELARRLGDLKRALLRSLQDRAVRWEETLRGLFRSRVFQRPLVIYEQKSMEADEAARRLFLAWKHRGAAAESQLRAIVEKLDVLSPLACLSRGYAIATKFPDGAVVKEASQVSQGERVSIRLHRGRLVCEVSGIQN